MMKHNAKITQNEQKRQRLSRIKADIDSLPVLVEDCKQIDFKVSMMMKRLCSRVSAISRLKNSCNELVIAPQRSSRKVTK